MRGTSDEVDGVKKGRRGQEGVRDGTRFGTGIARNRLDGGRRGHVREIATSKLPGGRGYEGGEVREGEVLSGGGGLREMKVCMVRGVKEGEWRSSVGRWRMRGSRGGYVVTAKPVEMKRAQRGGQLRCDHWRRARHTRGMAAHSGGGMRHADLDDFNSPNISRRRPLTVARSSAATLGRVPLVAPSKPPHAVRVFASARQAVAELCSMQFLHRAAARSPSLTVISAA